jgi:hypothetical protein
MKTDLLKKTALFCTLSSGLFAIENGIYLEAGVGLGYEDSVKVAESNYIYDRDYILDASVGYQYTLFRAELEIKYKKDSLQSVELFNGAYIQTNGDFTQTTEMINAYYSGYNSTQFVTSIGAGLGLTTKEFQTIKESGIFSAQLLLSVGYRVTEHFIISTKYSYFYTQESGKFDADAENNFLLSTRYIF